MAHRYFITAAITGGRAITRSFIAAYKQASASSQYQRYQQKSGNTSSSPASTSHGLTLEEACKILNVKPPQGGQTNLEEVQERFKKLFDTNDPKKGGSFYLQSKILRAKDRIEGEVRKAEEKLREKEEAREGWKPNLYKNR